MHVALRGSFSAEHARPLFAFAAVAVWIGALVIQSR